MQAKHPPTRSPNGQARAGPMAHDQQPNVGAAARELRSSPPPLQCRPKETVQCECLTANHMRTKPNITRCVEGRCLPRCARSNVENGASKAHARTCCYCLDVSRETRDGHERRHALECSTQNTRAQGAACAVHHAAKQNIRRPGGPHHVLQNHEAAVNGTKMGARPHEQVVDASAWSSLTKWNAIHKRSGVEGSPL